MAPAPAPDSALDSVLDALEHLALTPGEVSLAQVLSAIGSRGFGPLMVVFSAFLILPVGMIPGVPAVVAGILMLIGGHLIIERRRLWVPARLGRLHISSRILAASVKRAHPVVAFLRPVLARRFETLVEGVLALRLIGVILIATGAVIMFVGFIPGLPFALSLHILVLGLALTARDGLMGLLGYAAVAPELAVIWWIFA